MTSSSTNSSRAHGRNQNQLRPVKITRGYTVHAEGSVLIEFGDTRVLCTASVEEKVPGHKKGSGETLSKVMKYRLLTESGSRIITSQLTMN